jgi:hypothetical protein
MGDVDHGVVFCFSHVAADEGSSKPLRNESQHTGEECQRVTQGAKDGSESAAVGCGAHVTNGGEEQIRRDDAVRWDVEHSLEACITV